MALRFVLTIGFAISVSGSASRFTSPPPPSSYQVEASDLVFSVGQNITLRWDTPDAQDVELWLMQDGGDGVCERSNYRMDTYNFTIVDNPSQLAQASKSLIRTQTSASRQASTSHLQSSSSTGDLLPTPSSTTTGESSPTTASFSSTSSEATLIPSSSTTTNSNLAIPLGAGIGVPLSIVSLAAFLWVLLQHRRKMKTVDESILAFSDKATGYRSHSHLQTTEGILPIVHELQNVEGPETQEMPA